MNKFFAIALLAIVASASATSMLEKYQSAFTFSNKRSIMNVMAQVEATLKNGGPLDAITRVLDEFDAGIRAEQLAHDQLYARQTAECEDEFEFRTSEIEDANSALTEATETLTGCQAQQVRAKEDLAITKKQLKESNAQLINVHTSRKREKYAFDTLVGAYQLIVPAIDEALEYLDLLVTGEASFIQLTRHVNKMTVVAAQIRMASHMTPVIAGLTQLSSEEVLADQALIDRVKSLFVNYRAKAEAVYAEAVQVEEAAIAKYNADVARLTQTIANLEQQQEDLETEISELDKCIITQQNIVASATQKIDRNQRLLDDAVKMCAAMDQQYVSAKEGRSAELELLAAITVKVEEHFAKLSSGVTARGELDNFDSTYTNASEYNEKEFVPAY